MPKPRTEHPKVLRHDDYPERLRKVLIDSEINIDCDELHIAPVNNYLRISSNESSNQSKAAIKDQELLDLLNTLDTNQLPSHIRKRMNIGHDVYEEPSIGQTSMQTPFPIHTLRDSFR